MTRLDRTHRAAEGVSDDPEQRFCAPPWIFRRLAPRSLWRRIRLPIRRRRWIARSRTILAPYAKADTPSGHTTRVAAIGDFSGGNGLSRAALYELARLRVEHPDLDVIDASTCLARKGRCDRLDGPPLDRLYILSAPDTYARILPALHPERIAQARRIGLWVWETPTLTDEWRTGFRIVHEIWTPSRFSARAIEHDPAGAGVPVTIRPHPVALPETRTPFDRAAEGLAGTRFLGVAIMDLRSCPARKNPWAHIAAWQAAFGDRADHVLLMKLRFSKHTACVRAELEAMARESGNIRLMERDMTDAEIAGLQAGADAFLSLHRAEGYGLNIRECLELGVPVVATDWSANAEYGGAYPNYHGIPSRLVPYRDWTGHYPSSDFHWAEADIAAAAACLRRLAARP